MMRLIDERDPGPICRRRERCFGARRTERKGHHYEEGGGMPAATLSGIRSSKRFRRGEKESCRKEEKRKRMFKPEGDPYSGGV